MIAERIKQLRERNKMTQARLAHKLHITGSAVNSWEMGISVPSTAILMDLADLFHVSTDFLLGMQKTSTIDISQLNDNEVLLLQRMIAYFMGMKKMNEPPKDDNQNI